MPSSCMCHEVTTVRHGETELDSVGQDPEHVSTDQPACVRADIWRTGIVLHSAGNQRISRLAAIPMGEVGQSARPSVSPTLVRTQHLPLPAETARGLGFARDLSSGASFQSPVGDRGDRQGGPFAGKHRAELGLGEGEGPLVLVADGGSKRRPYRRLIVAETCFACG